ncbi:carboxypeptidase regulatory-like domain-containing protein [Gemmatimonas sp.]|uniref:TonB-dependent receptor n=1 Tax=Gemmatimonas sp. TaxID=1962908 RepID=UPI0027BAB3B4|nr:carboxypeptidase regulatory-like domain-containing protein [Gemmatimonas sp.]
MFHLIRRAGRSWIAGAVAMFALATARPVEAQVTTSAIRGAVTDSAGKPIENVRIDAVHQPSGTRYSTGTRADGGFAIIGMRIGGPYQITASALGFRKETREIAALTLGVTSDVRFKLTSAAVQLQAITTQADPSALSTTRTGAATSVTRQTIDALPTISRRIGDFTRLTPQASGSSFAGQDNRLNNITVDGSYFNNSFGLGGQPGDRTGVAPISLDAIEQIQVNIAPFDVRQGNFTGAGVNTVTRSGTNQFNGSAYYFLRNQRYVGRQAGANAFNPGTFDFAQVGARLGGPLIKDKLFFFASYEEDKQTQPGILRTANPGGAAVTGNMTRVLQSDLTGLTTFLRDRFKYETGPYTGYDNETPSQRLLSRFDYNLNDKNKFSLRFTALNSNTDVNLSTSSSLGFGRANNNTFLSFQNSNYQIQENIRSVVGEWNSLFGDRMANNFIIGYTSQDESRQSRGSIFPFVDILQDGTAYTSFGFEPFTPNNELRYKSFQIQNNLTVSRDKHEFTLGGSFEKYRSENVFFPGSQSSYVYNSLADFYTDANDYLANPNRTTSPVTLRRFQVRWANIPGQEKPIQPLEVMYGGIYLQDEYRASDNLRFTAGLRMDVPVFGETGFTNAQANGYTFRDENGNAVQYQTQKLPDANLLWSPRLGFNWDVTGDQKTQIRGGTGVFTGRPAYVWISNQIGNNGVLTGFESVDNVRNRPFNPNPNAYKPATVNGTPAAQYELALTDPTFKFPQIWRSNIAVDRRLFWGLNATAEFLYSKDVNGVYYIDANLAAPTGAFVGPDNRPRYSDTCPASGLQVRLNCNVQNAIVLKNQDVGSAWNASFALERGFRSGFFAKAAYNYGMSRNTVDPGSIAAGSFTGNPMVRDANNPGVGISGTAAGHRFFVTASYERRYFDFGKTGISFYFEGRNAGNTSYTFSGDLNGDGIANNELIYVAKDRAEMNFEAYTPTGGRLFSVAEQQDAWEAFINQDKYLSSRRGQYAERGAVFLPMVYNADVSITQDIFARLGGQKNTLQLRFDILNFGNLLNDNWGQGLRLINTRPLVARGADANGKALYRMANLNPTTLLSKSFERTAGTGDVWRMQLGLRYLFN